jgi:hypothetical protein
VKNEKVRTKYSRNQQVGEGTGGTPWERKGGPPRATKKPDEGVGKQHQAEENGEPDVEDTSIKCKVGPQREVPVGKVSKLVNNVNDVASTPEKRGRVTREGRTKTVPGEEKLEERMVTRNPG